MQVFAKICKITSIELSRSDVRTGVVIDAPGDPLSLSRDVASGSPGDNREHKLPAHPLNLTCFLSPSKEKEASVATK